MIVFINQSFESLEVHSNQQGPYTVFNAPYSLSKGYPLDFAHSERPAPSSKKGNVGVTQIMI